MEGANFIHMPLGEPFNPVNFPGGAGLPSCGDVHE